MQRDRGYLLDILEASRLALSYIQDRTEQEFIEDVQLQDSVIRRLEIIGEASRHVSEQTKETLSSLPWNDMVGMRNVLIHEYGDIDLHVVWDTLQMDLPTLVLALEEYLE